MIENRTFIRTDKNNLGTWTFGRSEIRKNSNLPKIQLNPTQGAPGKGTATDQWRLYEWGMTGELFVFPPQTFLVI